MGRLIFVWLLGVAVATASSAEPNLEKFQFEREEMAVPIKIVLYGTDATTANRGAQSALDRVHALNAVCSDYDPKSELRRLCDTSGEGKAVPVSEDLWRVLTRANEIAELSDGAFDVTIGPMIRIWRRARRLHELPEPEKITEVRQLVGYRLVRFDPERRAIELTKKGMRLDLGGIAKGYAAEEALKVLKRAGLPRAMVYAGGDVALGDPPPGKSGWVIGMSRPDVSEKPRIYLNIANCSVATSGDTMQYSLIDGRRYSHVIDPKTGIGLTDHNVVSVVASDGATADALAKVLSVLGPEKGLKLVDRIPGAAAHMYRLPDDKLQEYQSSRWKDLPKTEPEPAEKR